MRTAAGLLSGMLLLAAAPSAGRAQVPVGPFKVAVRRSVINNSEIGKPAQVQLTWPEDTASSSSVDIGVNVILPVIFRPRADVVVEMAAYGERHSQTLTDKRQDVWAGGLTATAVVGDVIANGWVLHPQLVGGIKDDDVKEMTSVVGDANVTAVVRSLALGEIRGPAALGFIWQPYGGVEYEHAVSRSDEVESAHVLRGGGTVDVAFYPFRRRRECDDPPCGLRKTFEIIGSFRYWRDFSKEEATPSPDDHRLRVLSARWYIDPDARFAVGFSNTVGEDPSEGLPKQAVSRLTFELKL